MTLRCRKPPRRKQVIESQRRHPMGCLLLMQEGHVVEKRKETFSVFLFYTVL